MQPHTKPKKEGGTPTPISQHMRAQHISKARQKQFQNMVPKQSSRVRVIHRGMVKENAL